MATTSPPATLDQPLQLASGGVLKNRLAKSALSEQLATLRNDPDHRLEQLYARWGNGGFGLIITGNVMVDRRALGEPRNVVIEDDRARLATARWATATKAHGSTAWVQLNHPGRQSPRMLSRRPVAPSPSQVLRKTGQFAPARALTEPEIHEIIERFATTAQLVVDAGFDGVQIHSAHGYLSSQFLSPLTNERTDAWGGTPEKRMRFLLEVVRTVRERVGPNVGVGVKLNSADFQRGGFTEEESMGVVEALSAESIDLLEISGGTYERAAMMGSAASQRESTRQREAYFLEYAEQVRARASMPLMLTGGLRSRTAVDEALRSGAVDVIGLGRPACLVADAAEQLLSNESAVLPSIRDFTIRSRAADDFAALGWHTTRMWRLADGKNEAPHDHPLRGAAQYLRGTVTGAVGRALTRPPSY